MPRNTTPLAQLILIVWAGAPGFAAEGERVDGQNIRLEFDGNMHSRVVAVLAGQERVIGDFTPSEFIRISGMTHVRTSPYYPQSNGKIERWHKSLKGECIRPGTPLSLEDARRLVKGYVEHYNNVRLNSAIGYITPKDMLAGHQQEIQADRDRKLEAAREQRKNRRQRAA